MRPPSPDILTKVQFFSYFFAFMPSYFSNFHDTGKFKAKDRAPQTYQVNILYPFIFKNLIYFYLTGILIIRCSMNCRELQCSSGWRQVLFSWTSHSESLHVVNAPTWEGATMIVRCWFLHCTRKVKGLIARQAGRQYEANDHAMTI